MFFNYIMMALYIFISSTHWAKLALAGFQVRAKFSWNASCRLFLSVWQLTTPINEFPIPLEYSPYENVHSIVMIKLEKKHYEGWPIDHYSISSKKSELCNVLIFLRTKWRQMDIQLYVWSPVKAPPTRAIIRDTPSVAAWYPACWLAVLPGIVSFPTICIAIGGNTSVSLQKNKIDFIAKIISGL